MKWNCKEILEHAKKDFEEAWIRTKTLIKEASPRNKYPLRKIRYGKEHPVFNLIQNLRRIFICLGFEEVINPIFIEEKDIYKQFGNEAPAILDRCYYLAALPRPDIGIKKEDEIYLKKEFQLNDDSIKCLKGIFHEYKKGKISGDDLVHEISKRLNVNDVIATKIINYFKEFKELKPIPSKIVLRSHMTSGWFITLSSIIREKPKPIKMFSIDRCFRREQKENQIRIRSYFSASCVVADEDVTVDDGKLLSEAILENLGFDKIRFRPDEKRSKYYAPDTQTEVFVYDKNLGWVEVATFGIYSPVALSRYDINIPVLNLGFGVERLAMIKYGYDDIRKLVYPQFYSPIKFSDRELAAMISFEEFPTTMTGIEIAKRIIEIAIKNAKEKAPCEFLVYEGDLLGRKVKVFVYEKEEGKHLLGPAYSNRIFIYNGNIYGLPEDSKNDAKRYGIDIGIRYIDGIAYKFAREIEKSILNEKEEIKFRVTLVRNLPDINLKLREEAMEFIMSNGKKIDVRGPVFINLRAIIK